eukprot:gene12813-biopygen12918
MGIAHRRRPRLRRLAYDAGGGGQGLVSSLNSPWKYPTPPPPHVAAEGGEARPDEAELPAPPAAPAAALAAAVPLAAQRGGTASEARWRQSRQCRQSWSQERTHGSESSRLLLRAKTVQLRSFRGSISAHLCHHGDMAAKAAATWRHSSKALAAKQGAVAEKRGGMAAKLA